MKKVLVQFSGLAWNLKSTIVDKLVEPGKGPFRFPLAHRLQQTNKSQQNKEFTPTPFDLKLTFLKTNEAILKENQKLYITDRGPIDYDIYDRIMSPQWAHRVLELFSPNVYHGVSSPYQLLNGFYEYFDVIYTISLQTANRRFINNTFRKQPQSSTAYLFDNPDKYFYYSDLFNRISDMMHNKLFSQSNNPINKRYYFRDYFKFTESQTPEEFIDMVIKIIVPKIQDYQNGIFPKALLRKRSRT